VTITNRAEGFDGSSGLFPRRRLPGIWEQLTEVSSRWRPADFVVFALIVVFGALQIFCALRAGDFANDDVFFVDAAQSLIKHGFYGINGYPETNQPPGLAAICALLYAVGSRAPAGFLGTLAVFGTLGFLASYELLRRQAPRVVAAAICLLLISSPIHFRLVTQSLSAGYLYFFTAMSALLVSRRLEKATEVMSRVGWGALLAVLVAASLMFASVAMALLGAILVSICVMFIRNRQLAFARLKIYLIVLLIGFAVEGIWMHRSGGEASAGIAASEWPVPGFPQSYLSQLKVKSGNYPELGMATPADFVVRIFRNASVQGNLVSQMLLRKSLVVTSASILVFVPVLLIALGWFSCTVRAGGGLLEWYFAGYEFIYLIWPWNPVQGWVFLPIMPLACLYMWRGGLVVASLAKARSRVLGAVWFPVALFLAGFAWLWVHGSGIAGDLDNAGLEDELSFTFWVLSAIFAAWMVWAGRAWPSQVAAFLRWCSRPSAALRMSPMRISRVLGAVVFAGLVVVGFVMQLKIGRANLDLYSSANRLSADAEAGEWVRSHTDRNAVVMARHVPTVYHYSERKVIWFPPSSNPQLLMEGIRKHKVDFTIVVRRKESYYLPPEEACFEPLLKAYPDAFHLLYQDADFRIFQVSPKAVVPTGLPSELSIEDSCRSIATTYARDAVSIVTARFADFEVAAEE
jgi:hypothetical protein